MKDYSEIPISELISEYTELVNDPLVMSRAFK